MFSSYEVEHQNIHSLLHSNSLMQSPYAKM